MISIVFALTVLRYYYGF